MAFKVASVVGLLDVWLNFKPLVQNYQLLLTHTITIREAGQVNVVLILILGF